MEALSVDLAWTLRGGLSSGGESGSTGSRVQVGVGAFVAAPSDGTASQEQLNQARPDPAAPTQGAAAEQEQLEQDPEADIKAYFESGQTPLMYAVCAGHAACVEIILAYGANINQPSRGGWSPLHWAVLSGHPSCARMLLDNGADYNQKNDFGSTPLHVAVCRQDIEFVRMLVDASADITLCNANGATAFDIADLLKVSDEIKELVTPRNVSFGEGLRRAAREGNLEAVSYFVTRNDFDVDQADKSGWTALHYAVSNGHVECAEELVAHGASVDRTTKSGASPLHLALCDLHVHISCVALLLKRGAKVNGTDTRGNTPLHVTPSVQAAVLLLGHHADWTIANKNGKNALQQATSLRRYDIEFLLQLAEASGPSVALASYGLLEAAQTNNVDTLMNLVALGGDVNIDHRRRKRTPLLAAATYGSVEAIEYLLSQGADIHQSSCNDGFTALHTTSGGGLTSCVRVLLERGARVDEPDSSNFTPVKYAIERSQIETIELLLSYGAVNPDS